MWNEWLLKLWVVSEPTVAAIVGALCFILLCAAVSGVSRWARNHGELWYAGVVKRLVIMAEQQFIGKTGEQKRVWVSQQLVKMGMKVDQAHIESAVLKMKALYQLIKEAKDASQ
jgi:hypothetical protein